MVTRVQNLAEIKAILEGQGLRPNKSLGQNFLIESSHVTRLVDAAGVSAGDVVLEVGPGTGVLTDVLLERGVRVVACELDRGLAAMLRQRYASAGERFVLVEGDCLAGKHELNAEMVSAVREAARAIGARGFRLVANLPYGAASPLMIALATALHPAVVGAEGPACLGQFVTIQKEVGERLRAKPGTRDFGEMGVLVQAMAEVKRIAVLAPGCFWPPPKVESEMVSIVPRELPLTRDVAGLSRLCRALFTQRRKQLGAILRNAAAAGAADGAGAWRLPEGVEATARPEELTVEQMVEMAGTAAT